MWKRNTFPTFTKTVMGFKSWKCITKKFHFFSSQNQVLKMLRIIKKSVWHFHHNLSVKIIRQFFSFFFVLYKKVLLQMRSANPPYSRTIIIQLEKFLLRNIRGGGGGLHILSWEKSKVFKAWKNDFDSSPARLAPHDTFFRHITLKELGKNYTVSRSSLYTISQ